MAAVGVGWYLNVLDNSMLNVSLPTITSDLGTDLATIQWVSIGYLLIVSSLLLTGGRLGDMYGRKRVYLIGMVVFTVVSVVAGFAANAQQLIGLRVVQGIGSALVQGIGPAITVSAFPENERGRALGINSTAVALGGMSGPVLGGIIADTLGWRWIFFARIPIALVVLAVFFLVVPNDRPARAGQRFDVGGATTLFFALSTLLLGVTQGHTWGWTSAPVLGLIGGSLLLFALFVWVELRVPQPMLPLGVFRNRLFSAASVSAMLNFCGASASFFVMPFLLVQGLLMTPSRAGLLLVPQMFMMFVAAPISGILSDRFGSRVLTPVGGVLTGMALLSLSRLTPESTELDVIWRSGLLGLGMATFNSPNNSALMGSVPRSQVGLAGGTMSLMRNLGNVVGVAVAATVLTAREALHALDLSAAGVPAPQLAPLALIGGARDALLVGALIAFLGVGVSLVRGSAASAAIPVAAGPGGRTARTVDPASRTGASAER